MYFFFSPESRPKRDTFSRQIRAAAAAAAGQVEEWTEPTEEEGRRRKRADPDMLTRTLVSFDYMRGKRGL